MRARLFVVGVLVGMAACASGSPVQLWTGSSSCYLSNARGELVADDSVGVAIIEKSAGNPDRTTKIRWPGEFTARRSGSEVDVLDRRGIVVARTGTRMELQGGYGVDGGFEVCGLTFLDGSPEMTLLP